MFKMHIRPSGTNV